MFRYCCFFILALCPFLAKATHLRSGQIRVKHVESLTYLITVEVYTNIVGTTVLFGGDQDYLSFGDGSPVLLVPEIGSSGLPPGSTYEIVNDNIAKATYSVYHTYRGPGKYTVSYIEPNRNDGIANISESVNTTFYLETQFLIDAFLGYSESPEFLTEPIFTFAAGKPIALSLAASVPAGHELYYSLATPLKGKGTPVSNYIHPGDADINPFNGLLTWNGLFLDNALTGEYLLSVWVYQFDRGYLVNKTLRDVQILLTDSEFQAGRVFENVELDENKRIVLQEGSTTFKVIAEKKGEIVDTEVFSSLPGLTNVTHYDSLEGEDELFVTSITINNDGSLDNTHSYLVAVRTKFQNNNHYVDRNYVLTTHDEPLEFPNAIMDLDEKELQVTAYPNPTSDFFYFKNPPHQMLISVSTITGQPISAHYFNDQLDLREVPAGMYLITLKSGNQYQEIKVIRK